MSGLLVKSTVVMRENLEEMTREGIDVPVLLGGAALTRRYVEEDCVTSYGAGRVAYARDAFDGLDLMDKIVGGRVRRPRRRVLDRQAQGPARRTRSACSARPRAAARGRSISKRSRLRRAELATAGVPVPTPPFWGARVVERVPVKALVPVPQRDDAVPVPVGLPQGRQALAEYKAWAQREVRPILTRMLEIAVEAEKILAAAGGLRLLALHSDGDERRPARRGRRDGSGALRLPAPEPRRRAVHRRFLPRPTSTSAT